MITDSKVMAKAVYQMQTYGTALIRMTYDSKLRKINMENVEERLIHERTQRELRKSFKRARYERRYKRGPK